MTKKRRTARRRTSHAARLPPSELKTSAHVRPVTTCRTRGAFSSLCEGYGREGLLYGGQTNPEAQASLSTSKKQHSGVSAHRDTRSFPGISWKKIKDAFHTATLQRQSNNPAYLQLYSSWRLLRHGGTSRQPLYWRATPPNNPCSRFLEYKVRRPHRTPSSSSRAMESACEMVR